MKRKSLNLAKDFFLSIVAAAVLVSWIGLAPIRADGETSAGACSVNAVATGCVDNGGFEPYSFGNKFDFVSGSAPSKGKSATGSEFRPGKLSGDL